MNSVLTINANALVHNISQIKKRYPNTRILAYLKQNAYSMSDDIVSSILSAADGFGVTDLNAAIKLRSIYADKVIVDASTPPNKNSLFRASKQDITVVVYSAEMIDIIEKNNIKGRYWLKINTGFNRLGVPIGYMDESIKRLQKFSKDKLVLMTHFMDSDIHSSMFKSQLDTWVKLTKAYDLPLSHARSCSVLQGLSPIGDWIRPGLMLYGLDAEQSWDLKLAIGLKAPIYQIRNIKAGEYVGYDHAFQFKKDTRIAITAIGYGDGFPLHLSSESWLALNGEKVSIVGKVSMDFIAVDIGNIEAKVGNYIEIIGPHANIFKGYPFALQTIITNLKHRRMNVEVNYHV
ncbi:MAG: alanine racemase [Gammaproteobacteria bacterium]|nr:alanine racemase [Gammaproteobacteria bacterium]